jgi:hypothetical protein
VRIRTVVTIMHLNLPEIGSKWSGDRGKVSRFGVPFG